MGPHLGGPQDLPPLGLKKNPDVHPPDYIISIPDPRNQLFMNSALAFLFLSTCLGCYFSLAIFPVDVIPGDSKCADT